MDTLRIVCLCCLLYPGICKDSSFENRLLKLEQTVAELKHENAQLKELITHKYQEKERSGEAAAEITKTDSKRLLSGTNTVVAFHVFITNDRCFNENQVIDFDGEELDTHNAYNTNDGIYIVPQSGIYAFAWILCSKPGEWAQTQLIINGFARGWTISDFPTGYKFYNPSSNVVVANVTAGDHVFIRRSKGTGCTILGQQAHARATFSGWKLN